MSHITSSLIICYYKKNQKVRKWKKHSSVLISTWKFWTLKESVDVVLCCRIGTERIVRLILAFCLTFSILDFERVQSCDSQEFKGTPCPESKIMNLPSRIGLLFFLALYSRTKRCKGCWCIRIIKSIDNIFQNLWHTALRVLQKYANYWIIISLFPLL